MTKDSKEHETKILCTIAMPNPKRDPKQTVTFCLLFPRSPLSSLQKRIQKKRGTSRLRQSTKRNVRSANGAQKTSSSSTCSRRRVHLARRRGQLVARRRSNSGHQCGGSFHIQFNVPAGGGHNPTRHVTFAAR